MGFQLDYVICFHLMVFTIVLLAFGGIKGIRVGRGVWWSTLRSELVIQKIYFDIISVAWVIIENVSYLYQLSMTSITRHLFYFFILSPDLATYLIAPVQMSHKIRMNQFKKIFRFSWFSVYKVWASDVN